MSVDLIILVHTKQSCRNKNDVYYWSLNSSEVIVNAPQSNELSALQNTFYSQKKIIVLHMYIQANR